VGSVGLALEAFRKAWRENPDSAEALAGMAVCYDQMGRFDLSQRSYEAALALAPSDPRLLALYAGSLELRGDHDRALAVRREAAMVAAGRAPQSSTAPEEGTARLNVVQSVPVEVPASAVSDAPRTSVRDDSAAVELRPAAKVAERALSTGTAAIRPHLERLSMSEVALVTAEANPRRSELVKSNRPSTTVRFVPLAPTRHAASLQLLNAARVHRLAARTGTWLAQQGWTRLMIGDAPMVRSTSVILYPAGSRAIAQRLGSQLGFATVQRGSVKRVTVLLGRDAKIRSSASVRG
jgi:tetratricopeptide (TPR) repeat protein